MRLADYVLLGLSTLTLANVLLVQRMLEKHHEAAAEHRRDESHEAVQERDGDVPSGD